MSALLEKFRALNTAEAVAGDDPMPWCERLWSIQDSAAQAGLTLEDLELIDVSAS